MVESNKLEFTVHPSVTLTVSSEAVENGRVYPITVSIYLDGEYIGETPTRISLGSNVEYSLEARSGDPKYIFQYWSDGDTRNPRTVKISVDTKLTAYFRYSPEYSLTVKARDNYGLPAPAEIYIDNTYVGDTPVTVKVRYGSYRLEAKSKMPWLYIWDKWSDGAVDNPRTIHVTGDTELTALYIYTGGVT